MKKILFTIISAIFAISTFTSCNDPIFPTIRNEVALEEAQISGFINSIVRYEDDLYLQNGRIYKKPQSELTHGKWILDKSSAISDLFYDYYAQSFFGNYIVKLASDQNYVYALCYDFAKKDNEGLNEVKDIYLFYKNNSTNWIKSTGTLQTELTKIAENYKNLEDKSYEMTDKTKTVTILCTNTPQKEHRFAYIKIGTKLYQLDGTEITEVNAGNDNSEIVSAMYINGGAYFFKHLACGTNETETSDATRGYYADGKNLYYFLPAEVTTDQHYKIETKSEKNIISLAISKDSILLGTNENGVRRVLLDSEGVPSETTTYIANSAEIMCMPYIVRTLFSTYPEKTEAENTLYSSLEFRWTETNSGAQYSNTGLWAYYPARGNWNRE